MCIFIYMYVYLYMCIDICTCMISEFGGRLLLSHNAITAISGLEKNPQVASPSRLRFER